MQVDNLQASIKKIQSKKSKKAFVPLVSIVLSALITSFSSELKAADTPNAVLTWNPQNSISLSKTNFAHAGAHYYLKLNFDRPNYNITLVQKDGAYTDISGLDHGVLGISSNNSAAIINLNFDDISSGANVWNFNGAYSGNAKVTDPTNTSKQMDLNGYALVFNTHFDSNYKKGGDITANFNNNANAKINFESRTSNVNPKVTMNFNNSSLEGNILNKPLSIGSATASQTNNQTFNFNGNSNKGFAFQGKVEAVMSGLNLNMNFKNNAIGNVSSAFVANSMNASTNQYGDFIRYNTPTILKDATLSFNLDNSTLQGSKDASGNIVYSNISQETRFANVRGSKSGYGGPTVLNLNASNNAKVYANFTTTAFDLDLYWYNNPPFGRFIGLDGNQNFFYTLPFSNTQEVDNRGKTNLTFDHSTLGAKNKKSLLNINYGTLTLNASNKSNIYADVNLTQEAQVVGLNSRKDSSGNYVYTPLFALYTRNPTISLNDSTMEGNINYWVRDQDSAPNAQGIFTPSGGTFMPSDIPVPFHHNFFQQFTFNMNNNSIYRGNINVRSNVLANININGNSKFYGNITSGSTVGNSYFDNYSQSEIHNAQVTVNANNSYIKGNIISDSSGPKDKNISNQLVVNLTNSVLDGSMIGNGGRDKYNRTKFNLKNSLVTGNINIQSGTNKDWDNSIDASSVLGNVKVTQPDGVGKSGVPNVILSNTAGQTIGNISTPGAVSGTLDYTPVDVSSLASTKLYDTFKTDLSASKVNTPTGTKMLSVGNISTGTKLNNQNLNNNITFKFDPNYMPDSSKVTKITGGSKDSSYTFENLGTLKVSSGDIAKDIASMTHVDVSSSGGGKLALKDTSVVLNQSGKGSTLSTDPSTGAIDKNKWTSFSANFGNATLQTLPDGTTQVVPNAGGKTYTLTQAGVDTSKDPNFVAGLSSNGNIGSSSSSFKQDVNFVFTPGSIPDGKSGFTGKITGDVKNSTFNIVNAGTIKADQVQDVVPSNTVKIDNTQVKGTLGVSTTKDSKGVTTTKSNNVNLDVNVSKPVKDLTIAGDGTHNINLDFSNSADTTGNKLDGAILGGDKNSTITITGLQGLDTTPTNNTNILGTAKNPTTSAGGGGTATTGGTSTGGGAPSNAGTIIDALVNAGVTAINNTGAKGDDGKPLVDAKDAKPIDPHTTIVIKDSPIKGDLIAPEYGLKADFTKDNGYSGDNIVFKGNDNKQSLTFKGDGSITTADNKPLTITAGTGDLNLTFSDTGSTVVLKDTANTGSKSTLNTTGTSIIGDFTQGTVTNGSFSQDNKFFGTIGGKDIKNMNVTLGKDSLYSPEDTVVKDNYEGSLKSADSSGNTVYAAPTLDYSGVGKTGNNVGILNIDNPGNTLNITGLSKDHTLGSDHSDSNNKLWIDSNLVSSNTSITGDLYTDHDSSSGKGKVSANLSFDTTSGNPSSNTTFKTNHIGSFKNGSSLSFNGEGSLVSANGKMTTIEISSDNNKYNFNNTGANIAFIPTSGTKSISGDYNIKGTNLTLATGITSTDSNLKINAVFAKSAKSSEVSQLTTQDGSLLTSKTYANGSNKPSKDYILSSSLTLGDQGVNVTTANSYFTFIGDSSVAFSDLNGAPLTLKNNGVANINMINLGSVLTPTLSLAKNAIEQSLKAAGITSPNVNIKTSLKDGSLADYLFQNIAGGGGSGTKATYNYTIRGTTLKDATIHADKNADGQNIDVNYNIIFDNRDLANRDSDDEKYWSDSNTLGDTKLQITKSSLLGSLKLDDNVMASIEFLGDNSFGANAKLQGGNQTSSYLFKDLSLNFSDSSSKIINVRGEVSLDGVSVKGTFDSFGTAKIYTQGVVSATDNSKVENTLAFKNYSNASNAYNVSNINGVNYQALRDKGSYQSGSIKSTNPYTFTFIGDKASGLGSVDSANKLSLDPSLANATINVIDGGIIATSNINGVKSGNNTLNLYGNSSLSLASSTSTNHYKLSVSSNGLSINATIDRSNYTNWGASASANPSVDFDIESVDKSTDGKNVSKYNFVFNGGYDHDVTHSFYQGKIGTLNADSSFKFVNSGYINSSQIENSKARISFDNTVLKGNVTANNLDFDLKNGFQGMAGNIINSTSDTKSNDNKKEITFDFTDNNNPDKIKPEDGSKDKDFFLAGGDGSTFTLQNLKDSKSGLSNNGSITWQNPSDPSKSDGVFETLQSAGVSLRPADSSKDKAIVQGKEVAQSLSDNSTFEFVGSNINGDVDSKYSLGLVFDSNGGVGKDGKPIKPSKFVGDSINSKQNLTIEANGAGVINSTTDAPVKISSDKALDVSITSSSGKAGSITFTKGDSLPAGSSLNINHTDLTGNFITQNETSSDKKTTTKQANITAEFSKDGGTLSDNSILGTKDGALTLSMTDTPSANTTTILVGQGKSDINLNNAGIIDLKSSQKTLTDTTPNSSDAWQQTQWGKNTDGTIFGAGSSIVSDNTIVKGDIFTPNYNHSIAPADNTAVYYNLNFTPEHYFQVGAGKKIGYGGNPTNTIDGYSKIKFSGLGSLRDAQGKIPTAPSSGDMIPTTNLNIEVHNVNTSSSPSTAQSISFNNTGGVVSFTEFNQDSSLDTRMDLMYYYSLNLRGVSLLGDGSGKMYGTVFNPDGAGVNPKEIPVYSMIFANGSSIDTIKQKADGSDYKVTDSALGDKDYIETSSFGVKDFENGDSVSGLKMTATFIGEKSHNFYMPDSTNKMSLSTKFISALPNTSVSLINASGNNKINLSVFNGSTKNKEGSINAAGDLNLLGTSLLSNSSLSTMNLNATFDQRGADNTYVKVGQDFLTTNAYGALEDSILKVQKSSLNATLTLQNNKANLIFLGVGSLGANAKISGGSVDSNMILDGYGALDKDNKNKQAHLNLDVFKGFKGNVLVMNTIFSKNITDKDGITLSSSKVPSIKSGTYADADKSKFSSATLVFSDGSLKTDVSNDKILSNQNSKALSNQAYKFIDNNILSKFNTSGEKLDLTSNYALTKDIGYTDKGINFDFIGANSLSNTSGKIHINNDNYDNVYNFIDYGRLNLRDLNDSNNVNGKIVWVGNTFQVGEITGQVEGTINSDNIENIAGNTYRPDNGSQDVTFDFGGNTLKDNGDSKVTDTTITNGTGTNGLQNTQNSTYTLNNITDKPLHNDKGKNILDTINTTINPSYDPSKPVSDTNKPFVGITTGTVAITGQNIDGDIHQDIPKDKDGKPQSVPTVSVTFNTTDTKYAKDDSGNLTQTEDKNTNPSTLSHGIISGDGKKEITFIGSNALDQNTFGKITEGTEDSTYTFQDTGDLSQNTISGILNQGSTTSGGAIIPNAANNKGIFNFEGNTTLNGDIIDGLDNTNASKQTINIGKNSAEGTVVKGSGDNYSTISTTATVNATFGVGSRVDIKNKNDKSIYDFSKYIGSNAPVVADIDLSEQNATIKGFDGYNSLYGKIYDTNNTFIFGAKDIQKGSQWVVKDDSIVKDLSVYNTYDPSSDIVALNADTFGNRLSIIDLRGERALDGVINNPANPTNSNVIRTATLSGAVLNGATSKAPTSYNPNVLAVSGTFDGSNALIRMGVDTDSNQSDFIEINNVSSSANNNYIQIYKYGNANDISSPIKLLQVNSEINPDVFKVIETTKGLYTYKPDIEVKKESLAEIAQDSLENGVSGTFSGNIKNSIYLYSGQKGPTKGNGKVNIGTDGQNNSTINDVIATNWYLNSLSASVNNAVSDPLQNSLDISYRAFRIETNNLNLRMGELRGIGGNSGAWARILNGMGSDEKNNTDYYTTFQAGYDYRFDVDGGVNYTGIVADASMIFSDGGGYNSAGRNLAIGVYNTYIMENGFYVDSIMKYINLGSKNNFKGNILTQDSTNETYTSSFLLGGEVGYRLKIDDYIKNRLVQGWFVEPQLELIYGYIGGTSFNSVINGSYVSATLEGNNALITRAGGVIGKQLRYNNFNADIRLGLSYINELNSGGRTLLQEVGNPSAATIVNATPMNNRMDVSLSGNYFINDDMRVYLDIDRSFFGHYNIDYNLNVGFRYNFGVKVTKLTPSRAPKQVDEKSKLKAQINELMKTRKGVALKSSAKVKCEGCEPESGLYFEVLVSPSVSKNTLNLISKYSYRAYAFKINNKIEKRYLIGPFKNPEDALRNKPYADELAKKIQNNSKAVSVLYEVSNTKNK